MTTQTEKVKWNTSYRVDFKVSYSITDTWGVYEPVVVENSAYRDEVWGMDENEAYEAATDSFWQEFFAKYPTDPRRDEVWEHIEDVSIQVSKEYACCKVCNDRFEIADDMTFAGDGYVCKYCFGKEEKGE